MKRYVSVRVVDEGGKAVSSATVALYLYQSLASGGAGQKQTNSEGLAEFEVDADSSAEMSVSVNGHERVRRSSIQGEYKIRI